MELKDFIILEAPYLNMSVKNQDEWIGHGYISLNTSERVFDNVGEYDFRPPEMNETANIRILLHKEKILAGAYMEATHPQSGQHALAIISIVYFKAPLIKTLPDDMKGKPVLQVDRVATNKEYVDLGIASLIYTVLVKQGYVVLSDNSQYLGGMHLWKRMARLAGLSNYTVHIYNIKNNQYVTDSNNQPVAYNASNIDDAKIWSTGFNFTGKDIILIAK